MTRAWRRSSPISVSLADIGGIVWTGPAVDFADSGPRLRPRGAPRARRRGGVAPHRPRPAATRERRERAPPPRDAGRRGGRPPRGRGAPRVADPAGAQPT